MSGYTEDDVQLAAQAIWDGCKKDFENLTDPPTSTVFEDARSVVERLAKAGRLMPADAGTEWGYRCTGGCDRVHREPEDAARRAAKQPGRVLVKRTVGPWEDAR